jgi:hypothetical protein
MHFLNFTGRGLLVSMPPVAIVMHASKQFGEEHRALDLETGREFLPKEPQLQEEQL